MESADIIPPIAKNTTGAVIVTYNRGDDITALLQRIDMIVSRCVIIDNGSTDNTIDVIVNYLADKPHFTLLHNDENNLAKAQNIGLRHIKLYGCDWALLLDHDSLPAQDMLAKMSDALSGYPEANKIGMLIPQLNEPHTNREARYYVHYRRLVFWRITLKQPSRDDIMIAIASGSLIRMALPDDVITMNETYNIDYVDIDFCLRLLRSGKKILAVRDAGMQHSLGDSREHTVSGISVTTRNHSPGRRFTIYRNRLWCLRAHGFAFPAYAFSEICAMIYDVIKIVIFEENKLAKFKAISQGIRAVMRK